MTNLNSKFKAEKKKSRKLPVFFLVVLALIGAGIAAGFYLAPERRAERSLALAREAREGGDEYTAVKAYEEALAAKPEQEVMIELADLHLDQQEHRQAKGWLDRAAAIDPLAPAYLDELYRYAMIAEDYPLAASLLGNSEVTEASLPDLSALVGGLLDAGLFSDAEQAISEGLLRYPDAPELLRAQMELYLLREDVPGVLEHYKQYPEVFAGKPDLLTFIAAQQAKKLRWEDAAATIRELIHADGETASRLQDLYLYEARAFNIPGLLDAGRLLHEHDYEIPASAPQIIGNTSGNMANGGFAASEGTRIYYLHHEDRAIMATDHGLASRTLISRESAAYLNAVDGWLYFRNNSRDGALYKVGTDGSDLMRLSQGEADLVGVWGRYVYYRAPGRDNRLYRCTLDGTETRAVTEGPIRAWASDGITIWAADAEGLFRFRIEDIPQTAADPAAETYPMTTVLAEGIFSYLNAGEDYLYYLRHTDDSVGGMIERMPLDSGDAEPLAPGLEATDLNYADGYLYFTRQTLHRLSTSNLYWEKLGISLTQNMQIAGPWIIARSPENDLPLVRLHPDGSNWGLLDDTLR